MNYMGVDMPMEFKVNGDDLYMKMSASQGSVSYVQEYYVVGGKMYILDSAKKTYSVSNNRIRHNTLTLPSSIAPTHRAVRLRNRCARTAYHIGFMAVCRSISARKSRM